MGELYDQLLSYFKNTPKEQLDKDWEEIKHWNEIGPDVEEWAEFAMEECKKRNNEKLR